MGVHPADQIATGKVADEQKQRVGGLVEVAIAQVMARQRAAADVIGLGAGPAGFFVAAAVEMPVALELGAPDASTELLVNVGPGRSPVLLHVVVGNLIGDALVAQRCHQPIEHGADVAVADRGSHLISSKVGSNVVDQARRTGEAANCVDDPNSMVECCPGWFGNFWMILTQRLSKLNLPPTKRPA